MNRFKNWPKILKLNTLRRTILLQYAVLFNVNPFTISLATFACIIPWGPLWGGVHTGWAGEQGQADKNLKKIKTKIEQRIELV